jgi:hypothetical protein
MASDAAPFLMVDPVHDMAHPLAVEAFAFLSAPRSRVMARHATALFLSQTGEVLHLVGAYPQPAGPWTALKLRFGYRIPAIFDFEVIEMPLADFKTMLLDCAAYMRDSESKGRAWWLSSAPLEEVRETLAAPETFQALYRAVPMTSNEIQGALI